MPLADAGSGKQIWNQFLSQASVSVGPTYIRAMLLRLRLWKLLQVYFCPSHMRELPSDITSISS